MARTKAFDPEKALERAMMLFWQRGYEGTSMQALVEHMGVNRSSLYDTFGDKRALYLAALDRYARMRTQAVAALMARDLPVKELFRELFEEFVAFSLHDPHRMGCFVVNAVTEQAPHDAETATRTHQCSQDFEASFFKALVRAGERGELGREQDPRRLARFFVNAYTGLRVMVKTTTDRAVLDDIVAATLSVLE